MNTTATAAVAHEAQAPFKIEEVTLDALRPNELLVRIEAVGVCHSDAVIKQMWPLPAVLGHEGMGIVEEVGGEVTYAKPGDRVVISYPHCEVCHACEDHRPSMCDNFTQLAFGGTRPDGSPTIFLDGKPINGAFFAQSSFATKAITTESNIVKVDNWPDDEAKQLAALPCGIITGAGTALNVLKIKKGESLAVFGGGAVGLSAVMAAASVGAGPIIVVDVVEERLKLAKELGATHTINGMDKDVPDQVHGIVKQGVNYCFDTSGNVTAFNNAVASARRGAVMAIVTAPNYGGTFEFDCTTFMSNGMTLVSVTMGSSNTREFIPYLIQLNREGRFPYEKLITYYDFEDINQAFEDSHKGTAIKPVLVLPKAK